MRIKIMTLTEIVIHITLFPYIVHTQRVLQPTLDIQQSSKKNIEDVIYTVEAKKEDRVQAANPLFYVLASDVWWSEGASSSGGVGPSTSGALPVDAGFQYVCED